LKDANTALNLAKEINIPLYFGDVYATFSKIIQKNREKYKTMAADIYTACGAIRRLKGLSTS